MDKIINGLKLIQEMDNLFKNKTGYIYALKSLDSDSVYIGSTFQSLKKRLCKHRTDYKRYLQGKMNYVSSFQLISHPNHYIEEIKVVHGIDKKSLQKLEGREIENNPNCINTNITGRARSESVKAYFLKNRDKIYEKLSQKIVCECGRNVSKGHIARQRKRNCPLR